MNTGPGCDLLTLLLLATLACTSVQADTMVLPPAEIALVGRLRTHLVRDIDTLAEIARRYDVGRYEMLSANPGMRAWSLIPESRLEVPTRFILPDAPRQGLVLNLPEYRLYHYWQHESADTAMLSTYPVSIGRVDWTTPLGTTSVVQKRLYPTWTPPASIRQEANAAGRTLPDVVPAGPDNPLGDHALRLAIPGYLLHGTNRPEGVGMRVTHGCVRLYPEDIEALFRSVPLGTPVAIIDQPVKVGWHAGALHVEVHPPLEPDPMSEDELMQQAIHLARRALLSSGGTFRSWQLKAIVREQRGIPVMLVPAEDS